MLSSYHFCFPCNLITSYIVYYLIMAVFNNKHTEILKILITGFCKPVKASSNILLNRAYVFIIFDFLYLSQK